MNKIENKFVRERNHAQNDECLCRELIDAEYNREEHGLDNFQAGCHVVSLNVLTFQETSLSSSVVK